MQKTDAFVTIVIAFAIVAFLGISIRGCQRLSEHRHQAIVDCVKGWWDAVRLPPLRRWS